MLPPDLIVLVNKRFLLPHLSIPKYSPSPLRWSGLSWLDDNLPIFDAERENNIIESRLKNFDDEELKSHYVSFIRDVMKISKSYQEELNKGIKVAFAGEKGAFADVAVKKIFNIPFSHHLV